MPEGAGSILALDLATKTGWAHSGHGSGVWKFTGPRAAAWEQLQVCMTSIIEAVPTSHIYIESPFFRGGAATRKLMGFAVIAEMVARKYACVFEEVGVSTIKKYATGRGTATKGDMATAAAKHRLARDFIDDNHIDALWLLEYAKDDLR